MLAPENLRIVNAMGFCARSLRCVSAGSLSTSLLDQEEYSLVDAFKDRRVMFANKGF
jgi:hypothetical protein